VRVLKWTLVWAPQSDRVSRTLPGHLSATDESGSYQLASVGRLMGIAVDIFVILAGLVLATNVKNLSKSAHAILGIAWSRMEIGSLNRVARLPTAIGLLPFWAFRTFFFLSCSLGGSVALLTGPR
jgi:hypothetical protein